MIDNTPPRQTEETEPLNSQQADSESLQNHGIDTYERNPTWIIWRGLLYSILVLAGPAMLFGSWFLGLWLLAILYVNRHIKFTCPT